MPETEPNFNEDFQQDEQEQEIYWELYAPGYDNKFSQLRKTLTRIKTNFDKNKHIGSEETTGVTKSLTSILDKAEALLNDSSTLAKSQKSRLRTDLRILQKRLQITVAYFDNQKITYPPELLQQIHRLEQLVS